MGNCCHKPTSFDSFSPHLKMESVMARTKSTSNRNEDNESNVTKIVRESMVHWSQLSEDVCNFAGEVAEIDNREVFRQLQSHPQYGHMFITLGHSLGTRESLGSLEVGHKFAEGGQAELFHAQIKWRDLEWIEEDLREGRQWVLKVFKKGTLLRHLQSQWPNGYLQYIADVVNKVSGRFAPRLSCADVAHGVLLKDGRFAFLITREQEDLRNLINRRMLNKRGECMPLDKGLSEKIMYRIAEGMDWLHRHNIVHRDLKAANVLYTNHERGWICVVADYECSVGVVGTGFWRAPEILQALKDKDVRPEVFTKEVDVYAFGMTCYEILSGKLPFEGHSWRDYDLILKKKQRPVLPEYVDDWMRDLVRRCWEEDPTSRPSFQEIMEVLASNSSEVVGYQHYIQQWEEEKQQIWMKERGER